MLLCVFVKDDKQGTMAQRDDYRALANRWEVEMISVEVLVEWPLSGDRLRTYGHCQRACDSTVLRLGMIGKIQRSKVAWGRLRGAGVVPPRTTPSSRAGDEHRKPLGLGWTLSKVRSLPSAFFHKHDGHVLHSGAFRSSPAVLYYFEPFLS